MDAENLRDFCYMCLLESNPCLCHDKSFGDKVKKLLRSKSRLLFVLFLYKFISTAATNIHSILDNNIFT